MMFKCGLYGLSNIDNLDIHVRLFNVGVVHGPVRSPRACFFDGQQECRGSPVRLGTSINGFFATRPAFDFCCRNLLAKYLVSLDGIVKRVVRAPAKIRGLGKRAAFFDMLDRRASQFGIAKHKRRA